jgi:hypothetical protein
VTVRDDGSLEYRCLRKVKYSTEALALEVAKRNQRGKRQRLWAYACKFCHCWHLSSSPPRARRAA